MAGWGRHKNMGAFWFVCKGNNFKIIRRRFSKRYSPLSEFNMSYNRTGQLRRKEEKSEFWRSRIAYCVFNKITFICYDWEWKVRQIVRINKKLVFFSRRTVVICFASPRDSHQPYTTDCMLLIRERRCYARVTELYSWLSSANLVWVKECLPMICESGCVYRRNSIGPTTGPWGKH